MSALHVHKIYIQKKNIKFQLTTKNSIAMIRWISTTRHKYQMSHERRKRNKRTKNVDITDDKP